MDHDLIRIRAHALWEAAGKPAGRDQEFWFAAEKEIVVEGDAVPNQEAQELEEGLEESFPASDVPASVAPHHGAED